MARRSPVRHPPAHDEDAAAGPHHIDVRAVELRQHRAGDDLVDGAERGMAVAEIEHAVDGAEQLVDLMRAEQHGNAEPLAQICRTRSMIDAADGRVEADQRLVEKEQVRIADQRLRDQEALAFAAGKFAQADGARGRRRRPLRAPVHAASFSAADASGQPQRCPPAALSTKSRPLMPTSPSARRACGM